MFQIQSKQYNGPFDVLLQMIESKKLEITELVLSSITADFLEHIRYLREKNYTEIGDFLVVAARLIFIKSRDILPKLSFEEEEQGNLEEQLKLYREIKAISKVVALNYVRNPLFLRGYFESRAPSFLPGKNITLDHLCKSLSHFFLVHTKLTTTTTPRRIIKIEEKIADILKRLESGFYIEFGEFLNEKDRIEVVVLFLALLELMKVGIVNPTQKHTFGEIMIEKDR